MTSEQANELHRIYRRGRESGLSDAQIESLLMLVDVVDWESKASPQSGPRTSHPIYELS